MAYVNLADAATGVDTSRDSIVIVDNFQSIRGGKSLDVTGFDPAIIHAGHPIIRETATGEYKPMPVAGAAFAALPAGHTYAGVLINTVTKAKPFAGIMVRGTVNHTAFSQAGEFYYDYATILAAMKAALILIDFRGD